MNPILRIRFIEHAIRVNQRMLKALQHDPNKTLVVNDLKSDIDDLEREKLSLIPDNLLDEINPCLKP